MFDSAQCLFVASFIANHTYESFRNRQRFGEETALINELIEGQKVVRAFGHEKQSLEDFDEVNGRLRE